jgi:hypothetical protein
MVIGYGLEDWGSISGRTKRLFSSPHHPGQLWGSLSPYPMGTRVLSQEEWGIKQLGHEVYH